MVDEPTRRHLDEQQRLRHGGDAHLDAAAASGRGAFLQDDELMPAAGDWNHLLALGFDPPTLTEDELFYRTRLPHGWAKVPGEDPYLSYMVDERAIRRVSVTYKPLAYDRRAQFHVINVGFRFADEAVDAEETRLPERWPDLMLMERREFVQSLYWKRAWARRYRPPAFEAHNHLARRARVEALLSIVETLPDRAALGDFETEPQFHTGRAPWWRRLATALAARARNVLTVHHAHFDDGRR